MANEPIVTVEGNIAMEPEIRTLPNGRRVLTLRVLQTGRMKKEGHWSDAEPLAYDLTIWDEEFAQNVEDTFSKGDMVLARGRVRKVRAYQSKGEQRIVTDVDVDAIGVSLRRAAAVITRRPRAEKPAQQPPATDPGFDVVGESPWPAVQPGAGWPR